MRKSYKFVSIIITITLILGLTNQVFAKTDEELKASNQVEFFVMESDGSWWSMIYSADGTIGNKYLNETIEGVQLSGIRIEKVSDYRYQLIPETQEQFDLLCGYETTLGMQISKLHSFLRDVDSPTANKRIENEKKQAEEQEEEQEAAKMKRIEETNNRIKQKEFNTVNNFDDVIKADWYYDAIRECESLGLISGYGDGNFGPNDPITMWQVCLITLRCVNLMCNGIPEGNHWTYVHYEQGMSGFEDDFDVVIKRCKENELIPGGYRGDRVEDPRFTAYTSYNNTAYREEAISCYYRAYIKYMKSWTNYVETNKLNLPSTEEKANINIPDYNDIDDTYKEFVSNAYKLGLASGYDNSGRFNPKGEITRAEFCQIIYNSNFTKAIKVILNENLIDYTYQQE